MKRCALLLLCAALAAAPASAAAADSLAPPGAADNWLPSEGWVWMHWLPFEERELERALGTTSAGIRAHLSDDSRSLATLARRRQRSPRSLARWLTRRFEGRVSGRRLRLLRRRSERILTQGHLAQHVLFHTFHGPPVPRHAPALFGVSREAFLAARQQGLSPADIARGQGRDPVTVRAGVLALLTAVAQRGVDTRSQSRAQARLMLARQERSLDCWMRSPLPKLAARPPTGDAAHHEHAPAIPGCGGAFV